jgi:hypothetical protein
VRRAVMNARTATGFDPGTLVGVSLGRTCDVADLVIASAIALPIQVRPRLA